MFQFLGRTFSANQADRYKFCYEEGCRLTSQKSELEVNRGIELLREAVIIMPESWTAYWTIAKAYQKLNNHDKAYEVFATLHRLMPDHDGVCRELMLECFIIGNFSEGVKIARKMFSVNPSKQVILALALFLNKEFQEALLHIEQVLEKNPKNKTNQKIFQIIKHQKPNTEDAISYVNCLS